MSNVFDKAVEFILEHEGGLSDDPLDSGGLTKYGISQRSYPGLSIRDLTRADAKQIYYNDYWLKCKCPELPSSLAILLCDSAVNQGRTLAVRILQRSLGVRMDGVIGPETIAAAHRAALHKVIVEFTARRAFQYALHPQVARYGLGWYRRLIDCLQLAQDPIWTAGSSDGASLPKNR